MLGIIEKGHGFRMRKTTARLDFLTQEFGFDFPKDDVETLLKLNNPGKPHIANLMVKLGYAQNKDIAIKEYIDKRKFRAEYIRPEEAISSIIISGGIPVLAHPAYGSGSELIVTEEMDQRLRRLIAFGLKGIEAYYSGFSPKLIREMLGFANKYNLYVTAGSDYHGKNKLVSLGDTNLKAVSVGVPAVREFLEDALDRQEKNMKEAASKSYRTAAPRASRA